MKIGYAYVVADLLHIGHLKHLQACRGLCDKLIVGVLTDGATMERKVKPIISFGERLELIKSLGCVDVAVKQETYSPLPNVAQLRPDILFESTSHKEEDFINAKKVLSEYNGRLINMPYYAGQSSTSIKNKVLRVWSHTEETHPPVINKDTNKDESKPKVNSDKERYEIAKKMLDIAMQNVERSTNYIDKIEQEQRKEYYQSVPGIEGTFNDEQ
ncbi:adenylyltransferase/cytidyltransferase family protein [Patescibacteria group bacterium]